MQISKERIQNYKEVHKKLFKEELSDKQAFDSMFNLVGFIKVLAKVDERVKQKSVNIIEDVNKAKVFNEFENNIRHDNIEADKT